MPTIVNRTVFRTTQGGNVSAIIPPTTAGNTLVIVQMGSETGSVPVINGIALGFPPPNYKGFGSSPTNTVSNGFSGFSEVGTGFNTGSGIGYYTNVPAGITTIAWPSNGPGGLNYGPSPENVIIYELSPCNVVGILGTADNGTSVTNPPIEVAPPVSGPTQGGFYIATITQFDSPTISGSFSSVSSPWVIDFQITLGTPSFICGAVALITNGSGTQQATWDWGGSTNNPGYGATTISLVSTLPAPVMSPNPGPPGGPVTITNPPPGTPPVVTVGGNPAPVKGTPLPGGPIIFFPPTSGVVIVNGVNIGFWSAALCAPADSTYIGKYQLAIAPMTSLFKQLVGAEITTFSDTTGEGRDLIVLDFNNGDGLYSADIGTVFAWPLAPSPKPILRVWQPSLIPMPEGVFNRPTDWDDGGTPAAKFIQGVVVEADSFNSAKTFQLQSSDDLSLHSLNEMPATFPKQTTIAFSCLTPFVAHSVRIVATDEVEWRIWRSKLVFEPWPEQCTNWQGEKTSFGMTGWIHAREMNIAYASVTPITVVLTFDAWPTITLTLPATAGALVQAKTKLTLPVNKFKLCGVRVFSTAPFFLFSHDLEMKVKPWGSTSPFQVLKVVGGPTKEGASV